MATLTICNVYLPQATTKRENKPTKTRNIVLEKEFLKTYVSNRKKEAEILETFLFMLIVKLSVESAV